MDSLRSLLAESQPLTLFAVIAAGLVLGQFKVYNVGLGVAGVLFAGIAAGAWTSNGAALLTVPAGVAQVGLILFVYAAGLTSGPGFFDSIRLRGFRYNLSVLLALGLGAVLTVFVGRSLGLSPADVAGVYCGSLTNTPALAAVTELSAETATNGDAAPAVGYSVAYPFGLVGGLVALRVFAWLLRGAFAEESASATQAAEAKRDLVTRHYEVTNPDICGKAIGELEVQRNTGVIISRHRGGTGIVKVPTKYTQLNAGDVVCCVGLRPDIEKAVAYFGAESDAKLESAGPVALRRVLVSRRELAGQSIESLELERRFNAQVTRLRRADIDIVPPVETELALGDRLQVVVDADRTKEVTAYFGDSERDLSVLDYTALAIGIAGGVWLGMLPLPLPGGAPVALGFAGGPLVAGLVLGRLGRSGPFVWVLPYEANQTLSQIGLLFFLAGVGVSAGGQFFDAFAQNGLALLATGFVTTAVTMAVTLFLLRVFAQSSITCALGATSGMQTQPATLALAREMAGSDEVYVAYATTYPIAMVGKILLAQTIFLWARLAGAFG